MTKFDLDLSSCRNRTQVTEEEYQEFTAWYMKECNIRVLKIRDRIRTRTVIDKITKETVCQTIHKHEDGKIGYLIWDNFYHKWQLAKIKEDAKPIICHDCIHKGYGDNGDIGCCHPYLYKKNGDLIKSRNNKIASNIASGICHKKEI